MSTRNVTINRRYARVVASLVVGIALVGLAAAAQQNGTSGAAPADPCAVVEAGHYAWSGYAYDIPVQPNTGEDWIVQATWAQYLFPDIVEPAYVAVDWNGALWVTSNASITPHITGFSVCANGSCRSALDPHGYAYKLLATLANPAHYNLIQVDFIVSAVDPGDTLTGTPCTETDSVSAPAPFSGVPVTRGPLSRPATAARRARLS